MDKKITRRVVLGTVLAGLAAGPFVIKSLRKQTPLTGESFDYWQRSWERACRDVIPEVKEVSGIDKEQSFEFRLRPGNEIQSKYTVLVPVHPGYPDSLKDIPEAFMRKDGNFSQKTIDQSLGLVGNDANVLMVSAWKKEEYSENVAWACQVKDNRLMPALFRGGRFQLVDWQNQPELFASLAIYCSFGVNGSPQSLKVGESWQHEEPFGSNFIGKVASTFAGLFELDNKQVFKIITKQSVNFGNVFPVLQDIISQVVDSSARNRLRNEIENARREEVWSESAVEAYFDSKTCLLEYGIYSKKLFSGKQSDMVSCDIKFIRVS